MGGGSFSERSSALRNRSPARRWISRSVAASSGRAARTPTLIEEVLHQHHERARCLESGQRSGGIAARLGVQTARRLPLVHCPSSHLLGGSADSEHVRV